MRMNCCNSNSMKFSKWSILRHPTKRPTVYLVHIVPMQGMHDVRSVPPCTTVFCFVFGVCGGKFTERFYMRCWAYKSKVFSSGIVCRDCINVVGTFPAYAIPTSARPLNITLFSLSVFTINSIKPSDRWFHFWFWHSLCLGASQDTGTDHTINALTEHSTICMYVMCVSAHYFMLYWILYTLKHTQQSIHSVVRDDGWHASSSLAVFILRIFNRPKRNASAASPNESSVRSVGICCCCESLRCHSLQPLCNLCSVYLLCCI